MAEEPLLNETEPTSDDKLFAALAYVFSPLVPIIILLLEDKKDRPFIKAHNVQALVVGIVMIVIVPILAIPTFGCASIIWLIMLYWLTKHIKGKKLIFQ